MTFICCWLCVFISALLSTHQKWSVERIMMNPRWILWQPRLISACVEWTLDLNLNLNVAWSSEDVIKLEFLVWNVVIMFCSIIVVWKITQCMHCVLFIFIPGSLFQPSCTTLMRRWTKSSTQECLMIEDEQCGACLWTHRSSWSHTFFALFSFFCRFSVNRRIFVVGFGLYGSIHGPTDYQVNIQVQSNT